uniref:Uncharacterized protein n=1 Tax=Rhipicephalus zambeziensis TaxID=60191 RepID=A0A224Y5L3_9ACAR
MIILHFSMHLKHLILSADDQNMTHSSGALTLHLLAVCGLSLSCDVAFHSVAECVHDIALVINCSVPTTNCEMPGTERQERPRVTILRAFDVAC